MEADFDSIEIVEYHQHTMQLVREDFVECIDCGNRDKKIEKIATWEGEDEN
jgi:putative hsp70 nucleotide exchange factor FES1